MDKTIKISKESMERFNHDKNVVGITQEELMEEHEDELVECPFNNQADLHSDAVFDFLFDNGDYLEHHEPYQSTHWVVGYIGGLAVTGYWWYGMNSLIIKHSEILYGKSLEEFEKMLINRTSGDGNLSVKLERLEDTRIRKVWELKFYYSLEWRKENLGY